LKPGGEPDLTKIKKAMEISTAFENKKRTVALGGPGFFLFRFDYIIIMDYKSRREHPLL
jgi:hypothetical protein